MTSSVDIKSVEKGQAYIFRRERIAGSQTYRSHGVPVAIRGRRFCSHVTATATGTPGSSEPAELLSSKTPTEQIS